MAAMIYTFHIAYEGLEDKIWRDVEVSSNYRLDKLGYLVLAAFDTMAYHLFEFRCKDNIFGIPDEDCEDITLDMKWFKLYQLKLQIGDRICMDYDFGTTQTFQIELRNIVEMDRGQGKRYPCIIQGAGQGIIDDMPVSELQELVDQIDQNGTTDEAIYYQDRRLPWNYRDFDLDCLNALLKGEIELIEEGYLPLWDEQY